MDSTTSILVTEEDAATRAFLADNLAADGYEVVLADSKAAALAKLETRHPDMVICDVNGETLDLLDAVRRSDGLASRVDRDVPLIVLTARADELSRVRYFDRGGDDVVTKPFSYAELRARIRALLHRTHRRPAAGLRVGPLAIDPTTREARLNGERVELSNMEFALLRALASEPTRVFTKDELLRDVWGFRARGRTRTLDSHACRLRHKLAAHGGGFVINVWVTG
ncbi:MAG: response regulator transcription factor [Solirubrobacteraceae bacterium]